MNSNDRRTIRSVLGLVVAGALVLTGLTGCTGGVSSPTGPPSPAAPTGPPSPAAVTVEGVTATAQPVGVVPPAVDHTELEGSVVELRPSGPLEAEATVHFRLPEPVPPELGVAVVTSDTEQGPWTYLPATLDQTRSIVTLKVSHFSFYGVVTVATQEISSIFEKQFMEALTGGLLRDIPEATCEGDPSTGSYGAASKKTDTLTWCLGYEGERNILRITNTRRYPLQLAHPRLDVIKQQSLLDSWWKFGTLSRSISGDYSIVGPGQTITYGASLRPGESTTVTTEMDGFGFAMASLQVGVETALLFTASPVGKEVRDTALAKTSIEVMDVISKSSACGGAVTSFASAVSHDQDPNVGALLVDCLAAAGSQIPMYGLIASTSSVGGLVAFFAGRASGLWDVAHKRDRVSIRVGRAEISPPPCTERDLRRAALTNGRRPLLNRGDGRSYSWGFSWKRCTANYAVAWLYSESTTFGGFAFFGRKGSEWKLVALDSNFMYDVADPAYTRAELAGIVGRPYLSGLLAEFGNRLGDQRLVG